MWIIVTESGSTFIVTHKCGRAHTCINLYGNKIDKWVLANDMLVPIKVTEHDNHLKNLPSLDVIILCTLWIFYL